jgi:hypothetical protein
MMRSFAAIIIVVGFFIGFGSGLVENRPDFASVPEERYYGFPFVWREVNTVTGEKRSYPLDLFYDILLGMAMVSIIVGTMLATQRWLMKKSRQIPKKRTGAVLVISAWAS